MAHRYQQSGDYGANQPYQFVDNNGSSAALNQMHSYPASGSGAGKFAGANSGGATRPWYKKPVVMYGVPILLVAAIAGGVAGGVLASKNDGDSSSSSSSRAGGVQNNAAGSVAATATNARGNPVYATGTSTGTAPAATSSSTSGLCAADNPTYTTYGDYQVRNDHPRLLASNSKWSCLPQQIAADAYLRSWNETIFGNATRFAAQDPVPYTPDGGLSGSGVLDVAREIQLRIVHWAYAYRISNDSQWVERTWQELLHASGNGTESFGSDADRWNTLHFLDVGEFTAAFAYAYDWMYDAWTEERRDAIMWTMLTYGISKGLEAYNDGSAWWSTTNGNWNCVCNSGLTLGALAIIDRDPTGQASRMLARTVPNAAANCAFSIQPDGTSTETSDYWYFASTGHARMAAGLLSSTGSAQNMLTANPAYNLTGVFHMYGSGFVEKFNYGDCGPNKYTATANGLMFYGDQYDIPMYSLYQRDRSDAPEPLSMLYYNPDVSGDWWYNLALDHHFPNPDNAWAGMRSSWTDNNGLYTAIKAGNATGHQTHGNLDTGDFVLEALGQRWAGELCHEDYLMPDYFASEAQDAVRWRYYRCATEGQNTILLNGRNQIVDVVLPTNFDSTGDEQSSLSYTAPANSAAYFWTDMSASYGGSNLKRGMRLLNQRRQVLLQDEITGTSNPAQWRMHTNATVTLSNGNRQASLALGGQTLVATILDSAPTATFSTAQPTPTGNLAALPSGASNSPNPGITVLTIDIPAGDTNLQVLFNPQWSGMAASAFQTPGSVALESWSLTSHASA